MQINCYLKLLMEEENQEVGRDRRKKVFSKSSEADIFLVFENVGGRLLILGEPGIGKTITLLQLAKILLEKAEKDDKAPFPVIFELATWKDDLDIEQWLVDQLKENYSIDRKFAQKWLETNQLLPLLDGLDELGNILLQRKCIEKINKFSKNLQCRLVVCCRWEEYQAGRYKLNNLSGAYRLLPPRDLEIKNYLDKFQKYALWKAIATNKQMKDFAQKPLFLNVMMTAYQGSNFENEAQLWENYIEERFNVDIKGYPKGFRYSPEDTKIWLGYLARRLEREYRFCTLHFKLCLIKIELPLIYLIYLQKWDDPRLKAKYITEFLIENISYFWLETPEEINNFQKIGVWVFRIVLCLFEWPIMAQAFGWLDGLFFGLFMGLFIGTVLFKFIDYKTPFMLESLDFSLQNSPKIINDIIDRTIGGLILGSIAGGICWLVSRDNLLLITPPFLGLTFGHIVGVVFGAKTEIKNKEIANQGIKETAKNTLIIILFTIPWAILCFSLFGLFTEKSFNLVELLADSLFIALLAGLVTGGRDCLIHLILRGVLFYSGKIPQNYADFLKFAVERKFIQQIGGRYRFLHNSLRKYFADIG